MCRNMMESLQGRGMSRQFGLNQRSRDVTLVPSWTSRLLGLGGTKLVHRECESGHECRVHRVLEKSLNLEKKNSRPLKVLENRVGPWKVLEFECSIFWNFCILKFWRAILLVLENCNFRSLNSVLSVCYEPCILCWRGHKTMHNPIQLMDPLALTVELN